MEPGRDGRRISMDLLTLASLFLIMIGLIFFLSGTVGLYRFPDIYTRLHVITKADNIGLGFIILGLSLHASGLLIVLKLFLIWFLVLLSSSVSGHLIARTARKRGIEPWKHN